MKILFTGGGTLGPVTPLLAVAEAWKQHDPAVEFVWVGTPSGPERETIEKAGIRFLSLPVARLTRYPSMEWVFLPVNLIRAVRGAWSILKFEKPDLIASAGGYTSVPVVIAARIMRIPSWIHQSDVRPILSNKLMAPFATWITVAFAETASAFPKNKTSVVGNPVRSSLLTVDRETAMRRFELDLTRQTVLIFGGGGGASWLNEMMAVIGVDLVKDVNVIHLTGKGKLSLKLIEMKGNYFAGEFLTDRMPSAYAAADLVICRAGTGTISELAALRKAAIIIPLPNSPQEDNARVLSDANAALVLQQNATTPQELLEAIRVLVRDTSRCQHYSDQISHLLQTNVAGLIVDRLQKLI